jgi:hypothetical protein
MHFFVLGPELGVNRILGSGSGFLALPLPHLLDLRARVLLKETCTMLHSSRRSFSLRRDVFLPSQRTESFRVVNLPAILDFARNDLAGSVAVSFLSLFVWNHA